MNRDRSRRNLRAFIVCACFVAGLTLLAAFAGCQRTNGNALPAKTSAAPVAAVQARILESYGKLPLSFEANQGQADAPVKFLSRTGGYSLFLTGDEAIFALRSGQPKTSSPVLKPASLAGQGDTAKLSYSGIMQPTAPNRDDAATHERAISVLRMKLRGANPAAKVSGADELAGTSNYFIGNDPAKWRTKVPTYAKVKYEGIYPCIDLVYYGTQRQLEYDFIVAPGADPRRIAFEILGARRIWRDAHGELVLKMSQGEIRWHKPVVYQEKEGARQEIASHYAISNKNRVRFEVAKYDVSKPLYIDPLIYSTYLGGGDFVDAGNGIAVDGAGNVYVTGEQFAVGQFPVTPGAFQTSFVSQNEDAFVTKINPDGSALVYSTFLGAGTWNWGWGIAVDGSGNAYVVGGTASPDFPTTPGAFRTTCSGCSPNSVKAFVTALNPTGSALVYSTYLGETDGAVSETFGIALDSAGNAYLSGSTYSPNFPTTSGAFQTACNGCSNVYPLSSNAFVSKLNPPGTSLVYSTYLGGEAGSSGSGIALDSSDNAYITGAAGPGFPTTSGAFQTTCGNLETCGNVFVTKINPAGSALIYSTYLGGSGGYFSSDAGSGIAVDSVGDAYVTGYTYAQNAFPTTPGAFQTTCNGNACGFVTKLNPTGSGLVYSTALNGAQGVAIAVDTWGDAYVTGSAGQGLPVQNPVPSPPSRYARTYNAFVAEFNAAGSALVYSTYLGSGLPISQFFSSGNSVAVDSAGNTYITGSTGPTNLPITPGAFQTTCGGTNCPFVSKIYMAATKISLSSSLNPNTYGQKLTWTATVTALGPLLPTGKVNLLSDGEAVDTATLNASGVATMTRALQNAGSYALTAVYEGDVNNGRSTSSILSQVIQQTTSSASLSSSAKPSILGQAVTFTAKITSPTVIPTGSVTFTAGNTVLGTAQLSGGKATFTTSTLAAGSTTVTATYYGDSNIAKSSASVTQTVH